MACHNPVKMRLALLMLLLFPVVYSQPRELPKFADFAVGEKFSGKPAAPVLRTAQQRNFRTEIREGAAKGPNFAGHFTIVSWGCGSSCVQMAVIDAKDGHVYDAPFSTLSFYEYIEQAKMPLDTELEPLEFHADSRLLVVKGCPQEKNCAAYFYDWAPPQFKLVRKVAPFGNNRRKLIFGEGSFNVQIVERLKSPIR